MRVRVCLAVYVNDARMVELHGPRPTSMADDVRSLIQHELSNGTLHAMGVITGAELEPVTVGRERIA